MDLGTHELNLPWAVDPEMPGRILDCKGIPVACGMSTTSVKEKDGDTTIYRTTQTAAGVRARFIVDTINAAIKGA